MLLLASLSLALTTSLVPEHLLDGGTAALLLRAQGGPALEITYAASWAPGRHQVFWRPPLRQLRPEEATLRLDPDDARVVESSFSAGRMAWTLDIPAQRVQKLIITVPINDIDWRLEASCRLADSHLSLQPYLSILSNGADTVRVDRVAVLSPQGDPVVIRDEPTVLIIGYRLRLPSGPPLAIPGRLVKRLYADRGEIRRLFLSKDSASIEQVIRLDLKALTYLTDDAYPTAATLSVTPDHGLQIDVGPERHVYIRRVLMDERRENPDLDTYGRVQGYDTIEDYHLEALLNAAIDLEVVEPMTAAWDIKTEVKTDTSRTNEVAMPLHLDAGKIASLDYSIIKHSGTRASR